MAPRPTHLIDPAGTRVAALEVAVVGDHFEGTVTLDATPQSVRRLFEEFEEIVQGQIFSLLDAIEGKIGRLGLGVALADGSTAPACDLQAYPATGTVSFRVHPPTQTARG